MLKKNRLLQHVDKVKYVLQEEFHWEEVFQDSSNLQEV